MIRVILADDEKASREFLGSILASKPGEFQIVGSADNGRDAVRLARELSCDVLFLDIEMPLMNGLEAASEVLRDPKPPLLVFVTAFNQYAVEAFEANAVDYILKPSDPERILKTLTRIQDRMKSRPEEHERMKALEDSLIQKGLIRKLVVHKRGSKDRRILNPEEVLFFHAHLAEVRAFTVHEEFLVSSTLKELAARLGSECFGFSHKSYLVNVDWVEKISPMFSGNFEISIKGSPQFKIPLSRRYAKDFQSKLENRP